MLALSFFGGGPPLVKEVLKLAPLWPQAGTPAHPKCRSPFGLNISYPALAISTGQEKICAASFSVY